MSVIDRMPIAIRAYTESTKAKPPGRPRGNDEPSKWALVFDCETTIDASQSLRFGTYQVRKGGVLVEAGFLYEPEGLDAGELHTLLSYAVQHGLKCLTREQFAETVFLRLGFDRRAAIIGFNLPFDISRLAISHGPARGSMRGGFTFELSSRPWWPNVRVKHLSRRAALIDFAKPEGQDTPRGSRKRKQITPAHRGFFIDVATLAAALLGAGFTLARLCERLKVKTRKLEGAEHGARLADAYLDYAYADVQATWECYVALKDQYRLHKLTKPLHRILSEASVGKAYLEEMGIAPLMQSQPDIPRALFGKIMAAYFGGRAEVRWRRETKRVLYTDFKSMYPTVNALMGLWRFVVADGLKWTDGTAKARRILNAATLETYRQREPWRNFAIIVRVRPDHDLFPVRAKYCDGGMHTIGLNYLTCRSDLWMTLADCIAAKLLSGKTPEILEAIRFEPGPTQAGLKPIDLFGDPAYRVDPAREDVFARLVDLRDEAKAKNDPQQLAIKIIANATSYGIFIEVLRDDATSLEAIAAYGPFGGRRLIQSKAVEQPGKFFHPLLGVLITGAARLMLALAERKVLDAGLDWAFCDTDSIAVVRPANISEIEFSARTNSVIDWFAALNPYKKSGSILKIEDANFALDENGKLTRATEPLCCFAISAKRYALFNLDADGKPIIRKASAHGLGHLMAPYSEEGAPKTIPAPAIPLSDIGVDHWQHDLWYMIIVAALAAHPDRMRLDHHPALKQPALTRFGVSSPGLERWLKRWNEGRPYKERVRPFGFMLTFQARKEWSYEVVGADAEPKRGRTRRRAEIKPVAPFDRDPANVVKHAFDRESGKPVPADQLKTYAEALAQFHLHPEDKFLNGDYLDRGRTERRHVIASGVRLIGKEANSGRRPRSRRTVVWRISGRRFLASDRADNGSTQRTLGRLSRPRK